MNPQTYCRNICRQSGSNFVWSFYLLPKRRRHALEAFYAFCRLVDDVVDTSQPVPKARESLDLWRTEVDRIYEAAPVTPVGVRLASVVRDFAVPKKYFEEILAGCEMDLTQKSYATFEEAETYCYRVASCVGLVSLHLFEVTLTEPVQQAAIDLGKALQWTNILRDIVSDLGRERIYLPQQDLQQCGVTPADLSGKTRNNLSMLDLLYFEIARARSFYAKAWDNFPKDRKEGRKLIAARMMGQIYESLLDKIARNPLDVFQKRVGIGKKEKLAIAAKIWLKETLNI